MCQAVSTVSGLYCGVLAGHAFRPTGDAVDVGFHQQDAAIVADAIADLEWRDQLHRYFPQSDLANAHA